MTSSTARLDTYLADTTARRARLAYTGPRKVVSCRCNVCKANAERLGRDVLSASVPDDARWALRAHTYVHAANAPSPVGRATALAMQVTAA